MAVVTGVLQVGATTAAPGRFPAAVQERLGEVWAVSGERCLATCLTAELVLTAAHCLQDRRARPLPAHTLSFRTVAGESVAVRVVQRHPEFSAQQASLEAIGVDLALLRLVRPLAEPMPAPLTIGTGVSVGETLLIPRRGRSQPSRCRVIDQVGFVFTLDCPIAPGDSGAAVLRAGAGAVPELVGVISAFETDGAAHTAIATEFDSMFLSLIESCR
nr:trypsin-like peptidase domain-containing protein [Marichromatium bheemlicum]